MKYTEFDLVAQTTIETSLHQHLELNDYVADLKSNTDYEHYLSHAFYLLSERICNLASAFSIDEMQITSGLDTKTFATSKLGALKAVLHLLPQCVSDFTDDNDYDDHLINVVAKPIETLMTEILTEMIAVREKRESAA